MILERKEKKNAHKQLHGLHVIFNVKGEAICLNFLPYFPVINRESLFNQLS